MSRFKIVCSLFTALLLVSCSQRTGYEVFRQMGYLECLKYSQLPAQECRYAPDYDEYRRLHEVRYPENTDK